MAQAQEAIVETVNEMSIEANALQHVPLTTIPDSEEKEIVSDKTTETLTETKSSNCFGFSNMDTIKAVVPIILFILFDLTYTADIATMFLLWLPTKGGGIRGCDCNQIKI